MVASEGSESTLIDSSVPENNVAQDEERMATIDAINIFLILTFIKEYFISVAYDN